MDRALADRLHRNLMAVNGWMGDVSGAVERAEGELIFGGRSAMPFLNGVMRERPDGDATGLLERARSFFFERQRGFVAYAWPGDPEIERAALALGMFPVLDRYPEMACRARMRPHAADVRPVLDRDDALAYWEICDAAYPSLGFPERLFADAFEAEDLLDREGVYAYLGYQDDHPVACASLWLAEGVGMVGWVASRPQARGRGLAEACTIAVTNRAFELGADVAALQASHMGEGLYERLGYEQIYEYRLLGAMPD